MRGAVLYGARDVRFEERAAPTIIQPTDAIIRMSATCVCRVRPVAVPRHLSGRRAESDGTRVLRRGRGGRPRLVGPVRLTARGERPKVDRYDESRNSGNDMVDRRLRKVTEADDLHISPFRDDA